MNPADVSIIVTYHEQRPQLDRLLPVLLSQQYVGEYEVIVVDMVHDKDTEEWLEEMEIHYPHLRHTFCPSSARGIDIQRLALTLGAKASNYEWLVIMPADAVLPSEDWLSRLTSYCSDGVDVVIGTKVRKSLWSRIKSSIFRQKLSIFTLTSSIFLCRRSILLQGASNIPNKRIIRPQP